MNELNIPFISALRTEWTLDDVDAQMDQLPTQSLDHLLWSNDGYEPQVYFSIAYSQKAIFLKFTVLENHVQMVYNNINDPVYKDTCVEFFISISNDINYYNLEFNGKGTCSIGYGSNKFDRKDLPADIIASIGTQSKLWSMNGDFAYCWDLTLVIPVNIFIHHKDLNLAGLTCRLNFYKCGDELPQPHFIAWNKVESEQPNFHLPDFFGKALFLPGVG